MVGLYAEIHLKNPSSNIREVKANKNCVAPYCGDPRLKKDIRSNFISNYFVFRLESSQ